MVDRFLLWLGAGLITAGMSAAMIAGVGVAGAQTEGASDANGASTSESTNSPGKKQDSDNDKPSPKPADADEDDDADDKPATDDEEPADSDEQDVAEPTDDEPSSPTTDPAEERVDDPAAPASNDHATDASETDEPVATVPDTSTAVTVEPDVKRPAEAKVAAMTVEPAETAVEPTPVVGDNTDDLAATVEPAVAVVQDEAIDTTEPVATAMAFAVPASSTAIAPTAAAPAVPSLLSVIGTVIFNLYAFATRLVGGPAVVPPGSSVSVRQSTLHIDCGDGYDVPADWYTPAAGPEPPTRLIYLQHGFLAAGPWYSYTAATLAEQTNSIVVAPSLTSNFLACDACWLGAPPMHRAVADLFEDGDTALADSLRATGYTGALPQRVVLVGHSLGGGLVAGTAGYMAKNDTVGKLAGVVMLDGVGLDDSMTASLRKVPGEIPIYQLAAPSYFWNQNGVGSAALVEARPDRFVGVVLEGGSHVDAMQGGNPLIQFAQELVAGFTQRQNVEAAKILMVGWVNDMFAGTQDEGIYGDPREELTINTPAGPATAIALPSSLAKWHPFNLLQPFVPLGDAFFTFEPTCVAESMTVGRCQGSIAA